MPEEKYVDVIRLSVASAGESIKEPLSRANVLSVDLMPEGRWMHRRFRPVGFRSSWTYGSW